jgi:tRNA(Ile)-lysidine synthase
VSRSSDQFSPEWLASRIAALLPEYPRVSLCVALSGGVDSTALLAALAKATSKPERLRALHVDHGLRPASKRWAAHCRAVARSLRIPLKVLTVKVERGRGESLEAAAREARYRLLAAALAPNEVLLMAHHADDQLETVLLQLLRGSGLPGIAAMPPLAPFANGWLARPLLSRSRAELEAWVRAEDLTWIEDDSNADERLDRNYLRSRVLPLVRERWPGAATAVARSARHAAEAQSLLEQVARADVDRASYGESLSVKSLRALHPSRRRNALRFWITRAGWQAPDTRRLDEIAGPLFDARHDANPFVEWGGAESPVNSGAHTPRLSSGLKIRKSGVRFRARDGAERRNDAAASRGAVSASDALEGRALRIARAGARLQRQGDLLSLQPAVVGRARDGVAQSRSSTSRSGASGGANRRALSAHAPTEIVWRWRESIACDLPHNLGKLELEPDDRGPIDLDALPDTLTIRWRAGGERLSPRRGGARRELKNLLQEAHVPVAERARLPLLYAITSGGAQLIAVADMLVDGTVQVTSGTRRRARLRWKKV